MNPGFGVKLPFDRYFCLTLASPKPKLECVFWARTDAHTTGKAIGQQLIAI